MAIEATLERKAQAGTTPLLKVRVSGFTAE